MGAVGIQNILNAAHQLRVIMNWSWWSTPQTPSLWVSPVRQEQLVLRNQECITIMTSKELATEALNTLVDALSYFRV